jgi:hypothetical protein
MFGMVIEKIKGHPIMPTGFHKLCASITVKFMPKSVVFMNVLGVEMMADIYAKHIRKDEKVYVVLRKSSELHHIEEGRHIFYAEMWLKKITDNIGVLKASVYSSIILLNLWFMRSLYIKEAFFERLGVENPKHYYKEAVKNYNKKFAEFALPEAIRFVKDFNGFNVFTKFLWNTILKTNIN